jgi:superfamily II DNA or RNA helicase
LKITTDNLTATVLRAECGSGAYERGRDYFERGRARLRQVREGPDGAVFLTGINQGSAHRRYEQVIEINRDSEGVYLVGECECPVGFNCKHVVATCLAWKANQPTASSVDMEFERWLTRFSEHQPSQSEPGEESLLYVLYPASEHSPDIHIDFIIARRKVDGDWGKGRKSSLTSLNNRWDRPRWMSAVDSEIVALLVAGNRDFWQSRTVLGGVAGATALGMMAETGRLFWGVERAGPLRTGPARQAELVWRESGDNATRLRLDIGLDSTIVPTEPPCYVDPVEAVVGPLELPGGVNSKKLDLIFNAPSVDASEAGRISRLLAIRHPELPTPEPVAMEDRHEPPVPSVRLDLDPQQPAAARLRLSFDYGGLTVDEQSADEVLVDADGEPLVRYHRDRDAEAEAADTLRGIGLTPSDDTEPGWTFPGDEDDPNRALGRWFELIETTLPELASRGWRLDEPEAGSFSTGRAEAVDAEIEESGNDWFSLRFDLQVDGWQIPLLPLISELIKGYQPGTLPDTLYLDAGEGHLVAVASSRIEPILETLMDLFDNEQAGEALRLSRLDATSLLDLGETRLHGAERLRRLARRMRDFTGIKPANIPTTFKGELRDYQKHGVNWLQFLREYELGGILADDMGLGKTVQTLANLAVEKRAGRMRRPSLIVAPTSLMGNWRREAESFTPKLNILVLHGPDRARQFPAIDEHDVVLTTYPLVTRDHDELLARDWHYLILDEAQHIKNPRAKAAQYVRAIKARHRLCLTGTPMENHLGELWAQFDFLMPGFLGDPKEFARLYRTPIEQHNDRDKLERLVRRTAPFLLRRTKDRVARELPEKSTLLRSVPIEGKQATLYESIRLTMEKKVTRAIAQQGLARSHIMILDALLKLRQVCCDPRLLRGVKQGAKGAGSAKLDLLKDMLLELRDEGRRILLFSQFTTMLGLIEREVQALDIPYTKLTGQTRKRDEAIERFRSGQVDLFLISLKAGGVGLNLTEADTVIHYDPWWNPAVETQATDRAHRIGQDKPVFVYKLITEGTVEEKILSLQERKRKLADSVYGDDSEQPPIDAETLTRLLSGSD